MLVMILDARHFGFFGCCLEVFQGIDGRKVAHFTIGYQVEYLAEISLQEYHRVA